MKATHKLLFNFQPHLDINLFASLQQQRQSLTAKVRKFVVALNFFKDPERKSDHDLRNQYISTRLFIVLMIITLSILISFTSLTVIIQTVTIKQPTIDIFLELQTMYPQTLVCPCSQILIDHKQFISFDPTFHQICSSNFTSKEWINYLIFVTSNNALSFDFRALGPPYFSTLLSFCNLSPKIIQNALLLFNSTKYVTKYLQRKDLFQSEVQQIVDLFKQATINSYSQITSMGRQIMSGNALFSGILTNYEYVTVDNTSFDQVFYAPSYALQYEIPGATSCSCKLDPNRCGFVSGIFGTSAVDRKLIFPVPGFWVGCYVVESLFGSTLECYFNQSCIDQVYQLSSAVSADLFRATAIAYNSSSTRYDITTKIQEIVGQLFIEKWNDQISFYSYYQQCDPAVCVYTYNRRGYLAYVFTTVIALIGGSTTILKILIPPIIAFLRRKKRPQPMSIKVNGKLI